MLYRGALPAMGTRFEIVAGGDDPILIQAAVEEALEEVSIGHHLWNAFSRQSLLARIHEAGATRAVPVDAITLELLCHCVRLHQQTGGHFDPAIGTDLVRDASCRGMEAVEIDRGAATVRLLDPRCRIDLGGIAKGYACDLAAEVLRDAGIECALIHGGTSSVVAIGAPPGREDWAIEIVGGSGRHVYLRDESLAVSAPSGGGGDGHIVDPSDGHRVPAEGPGVMVRGPCATDCDAWSTALTVAGFQSGIEQNLPDRYEASPVEATDDTRLLSLVSKQHISR